MATRRLVECPKCGKKVPPEPLAKPLQALRSHLAACRAKPSGQATA